VELTHARRVVALAAGAAKDAAVDTVYSDVNDTDDLIEEYRAVSVQETAKSDCNRDHSANAPT
jgi:hypothetical protein